MEPDSLPKQINFSKINKLSEYLVELKLLIFFKLAETFRLIILIYSNIM
jgi:hypothetical protein